MKKIEMKKVNTWEEGEWLEEVYEILADGEAVGTTSVVIPPADFEEQSVYVDDLGINEEKRNQGLGTQVLKTLVEKYEEIHLAPINEDCQRLYERLGKDASVRFDAVDQGFGVYSITK